MSPGKHHHVTSDFIAQVLTTQLGEVSGRYERAEIEYSSDEGLYHVRAHAGRRELIIATGASEPVAASLALQRLQQRLLRCAYGRELAEANAVGALVQSQVFYVNRIPRPSIGAQSTSGTPASATAALRHAQKTIGVNAASSLWAAVDGVAWPDQPKRSEALRRLLSQGFRAIERRLDHERADGVYADVENARILFQQGLKKQVMLRLKPSLYNEIVVAAHERRITLSALCVECIAYSLKHFAAP